MKIFQPIVSGSFTTSDGVFLKGLSSANQVNVILIDTASGQLYYTASSTVGAGSFVSTSSFNAYTSSGGSTFAGTSTNAVNAQSASNFAVTSTLQMDGSLTDYYKILINSVGTTSIFTQITGSFTSAFTKYTVSNGTNTRAGEFVTVWNGTTIVSYDNSTTDIGDTTPITLTSVIATNTVQISAVTTTSGWTVKALATFI